MDGMSRPLRLHAPGLLHHVFSRGNDKMCIFQDDEDCQSFLRLLATTVERFGADCVGYCLMWNHYHLLVIPHEHTVSRLMQQLNSVYSHRFNRRHGRVGHVLQGRFGCRIVEDGEYARSVLRYVALNPVAAGKASTVEEWRWSSYRAAAGLDARPEFLSLNLVWAAFGTTEAEVGRTRFTEFVRCGVREVATGALLDGSDSFASHLARSLEPHKSNVDFVYAHRFAARLSLAVLLDGSIDQQSVEDAAHTAFHRHGYTLAELSRALSRDPSTISRWIQRAARRHGFERSST
jgi:putative transposase